MNHQPSPLAVRAWQDFLLLQADAVQLINLARNAGAEWGMPPKPSMFDNPRVADASAKAHAAFDNFMAVRMNDAASESTNG